MIPKRWKVAAESQHTLQHSENNESHNFALGEQNYGMLSFYVMGEDLYNNVWLVLVSIHGYTPREANLIQWPYHTWGVNIPFFSYTAYTRLIVTSRRRHTHTHSSLFDDIRTNARDHLCNHVWQLWLHCVTHARAALQRRRHTHTHSSLFDDKCCSDHISYPVWGSDWCTAMSRGTPKGAIRHA